ncbi:MAG: pyruvoyl-dependent arginine decarboxylase [Desulfobacterales bacterium]
MWRRLGEETGRGSAPTPKEGGAEVDVVPKRIFFTRGVGHHRNHLQSFELALRVAGIEI